ncbi:heavy-metal-associated domain-containing protein [bacterium]|nr:heavy-metal-associated domain-containing protein [bacterium]
MVKLPTIQCGMCKNTIESGLKNMDGILSVNIDVENLVGHINYNPGKIKLDGIEKAISALGYKANDTEADSEAYANLPNCCKMLKDRQ